MSAPRILRTLTAPAQGEPVAVWDIDLSRLPDYAGWTGPGPVRAGGTRRLTRRRVVALLVGVGVIGLVTIGPLGRVLLPEGPRHLSAANSQAAAAVDASLSGLRLHGRSGPDIITCPNDSVLVTVSGPQGAGTAVAVGRVTSTSASLIFALYPVGDRYIGWLEAIDGILRSGRRSSQAHHGRRRAAGREREFRPMLMNRGAGHLNAVIQGSAARLADQLSLIAWREQRTEFGGLLWGRSLANGRGSLAWVAAMTPGIGAASAVDFQITPESYILGQDILRQAGYPEGLRELGLWHSHPGYGAWLSSVDLEYFHLAYPQASMLSIVIDPLRPARAVFAKSVYGAVSIPGVVYDGEDQGIVPELGAARLWQQPIWTV